MKRCTIENSELLNFVRSTVLPNSSIPGGAFFCCLLLCVIGSVLGVARSPAQDSVARDVVVEAEDLPSAYGAPPDLSRGRISTLTKSYVLPPFNFELESLYEADIFRHGPPLHLFTQEIEMGLPGRFDVAFANELERFNGSGGERRLSFEARYALANWNKIPLNPTLTAEYQFGLGHERDGRHTPDAVDFGLLLSHDFRHMVEWAMNCFIDEDVNDGRSPDWGFSQSVEVPVLLPDEQLEIGLETLYRHGSGPASSSDSARGFVIGPTVAWRPTKNARLDLSPLLGCTGHSPILQMFVAISWSFGKSEKGETETPASTRSH